MKRPRWEQEAGHPGTAQAAALELLSEEKGQGSQGALAEAEEGHRIDAPRPRPWSDTWAPPCPASSQLKSCRKISDPGVQTPHWLHKAGEWTLHFRKTLPQRERQLTRKFNEPFQAVGFFM